MAANPLRILVLSKRQYMSKDLIDDRYGRFRELPLAMAAQGAAVRGFCLSYRKRGPGEIEDSDGRGCFGSPVLFEEMGVRYLGPIDGHDLPLLISTLEFGKTCDHPIVIHILTQKGKGYAPATDVACR